MGTQEVSDTAIARGGCTASVPAIVAEATWQNPLADLGADELND